MQVLDRGTDSLLQKIPNVKYIWDSVYQENRSNFSREDLSQEAYTYQSKKSDNHRVKPKLAAKNGLAKGRLRGLLIKHYRNYPFRTVNII